MNWIVTLYIALLFFILTPAVLIRLPPKGSKYTVAAFHAIVFGLIFHFTGKIVWRLSRGLEGFQEGATPAQLAMIQKNEADCKKKTGKMTNGVCVGGTVTRAPTKSINALATKAQTK